MTLATMYWYDKKTSIVEAIVDAIEGFTSRRRYAPSIVSVRKDEYDGVDFTELRKRIRVGYSESVTPSHFHLYPVVDKRTPVLSVVRRPYCD